jgi:hypothetical protein
MKSGRIPILIFLFLAIASLGLAESKKHSAPHEQAEFSAEDSAAKLPVSIPEGVKEQLSRDKVVQARLENEKLRAGRCHLSRGWSQHNFLLDIPHHRQRA